MKCIAWTIEAGAGCPWCGMVGEEQSGRMLCVNCGATWRMVAELISPPNEHLEDVEYYQYDSGIVDGWRDMVVGSTELTK